MPPNTELTGYKQQNLGHSLQAAGGGVGGGKALEAAQAKPVGNVPQQTKWSKPGHRLPQYTSEPLGGSDHLFIN